MFSRNLSRTDIPSKLQNFQCIVYDVIISLECLNFKVALLSYWRVDYTILCHMPGLWDCCWINSCSTNICSWLPSWDITISETTSEVILLIWKSFVFQNYWYKEVLICFISEICSCFIIELILSIESSPFVLQMTDRTNTITNQV